MTEEEHEETGTTGDVTVSAEITDDLTEFSKLFGHKQAKGEAARFAMAIGIINGKRVEKDNWKKPKGKKTTNLAKYAAFQGDYNLEILFDTLELKVEGVPMNILVAEYIVGGMKWIVENDMLEGKNFSEMKNQMPDLFPQQDSE